MTVCRIQDLLYLSECCVNCRDVAPFPDKIEHMDKVRLMNEDLQKGNTPSTEKRMGKEDES